MVENSVRIKVAQNSFQYLDFDGLFITTLYHLINCPAIGSTLLSFFWNIIGHDSNSMTS